MPAAYGLGAMPAALNPDEQRHVLGMQGNIWTEHARTEERVSRMLFPRVAAVAETAWSPAAAKDWTSFADRLPAELARYAQAAVDAFLRGYGTEAAR